MKECDNPRHVSPLSPTIHPGASEHYEAAEAYEARYAARTEDVGYYLRRVRSGDRVLEYGAGAGRLTVPLVKKGAHVLATDVSPSMLELLKKHKRTLSNDQRERLTIRRADMRTFRSARRFDVVVAAFHTVCHLYSVADVRAFCRLAYRHLHAGGALMFDLPLPRIDMTGYDPISQVRVTEMDGPHGAQLLTQRWFQPQEILMHLHYAGFVDGRIGADFGGDLPDRETSVFTVQGRRPNES